MSFFSKLFSQPSGSPRKIIGTMHPFTSAALLLVPPETYEHDDTRMKRVLVFLFGALDALIQQQRVTGEAMHRTLETYLTLAFPSMSTHELQSAVTFLTDASADPAWIPIMQRGGETMVDWLRGDSVAPSRLVKIVEYGMDDHDETRNA
jgi:hypothetical protein